MASSEAPALRLSFVGDLILDEPEPDAFFAPSAPVLRAADVVVGHVEVPHTLRGVVSSNDIPAPASDPAHLGALARAGFSIATLAGNHIADAGPAGVEDTIGELRRLGLQTTGAGMNLAEARAPALLERAGARVGVLSFNCVGPRESWAGSNKAGCAYVRVLTHYELDHATPGGPPEVFTFATPDALEQLRGDVRALRARVDVVIVALHKGLGHTPAALAMYERPVAHAAIDAGADLVVGHHAHILRGIELYRGKPIFHGLGNFVTVTRALSPQGDSAERVAWARRRRQLFGFEPDPSMPYYPFHPQSRNTLIAELRVSRSGELSAAFIPCFIDPLGRPVPLGQDAQGVAVTRYVQEISARAGLPVSFRPRADRVELGEPG